MNPTVKTISMPTVMIAGALFCRQIMALDTWCDHRITPVVIFTMLFITFCRVDMRQMRLQPMHFWLIAFQFVVALALYAALAWWNVTVAQGALICVMAPVAMAAVVIGGMLGANIVTMTTYSLLCNFVFAFLAPAVLSWVGDGTCSFTEILGRVAPMLVLPFVVAQVCRHSLPRVSDWVSRHGSISFYAWLVGLAVIMARTTCFILDLTDADVMTEVALAAVALVVCIAQFSLGRRLGRYYGDPAAGGQSLGQKNTILVVWISQTFLDPLSSIAPTAYIVWQNLVNSYQMWRAREQK